MVEYIRKCRETGIDPEETGELLTDFDPVRNLFSFKVCAPVEFLNELRNSGAI